MTLAAFAEVRIDDSLIVYRTIGGSTFSTNVVTVESGHESRNVNWAYPLGRWELGERSMTPEAFDAFNNFFNARAGRAQGFRFKNWADYKDNDCGTMVLVPGSSTTFQMFKTYTSGAVIGTRIITKPVSGVEIYRNGIYDAGASVSTVTGVVTPTLTTGTHTWKGMFDTPVRFDVDQITYEFIAADVGAGGEENVTKTYFHLSSVPIVQIR